MNSMKKFLKKIDWIWDYYFVFLLYKPKNYDRYIKYMEDKWGKNVL